VIVIPRAAPLLPATLAEIWEAIGDDGPLPTRFADAASRAAWVEAEFEHVGDVLEAWIEAVARRDGVPYVLDVSGFLGILQDYSRGDRPMGCCYRSLFGALQVAGDQPPEADQVPSVYWAVHDPITHREIQFMLAEQVRRVVVRLDAEGMAETTPADAGLVGSVGTGPLYETA